MSATDEEVLVVPRASLVPEPGWLGLRAAELGPVLRVIARDGRFVARPSAEADPSLKQVIPYLVLRDASRVFLMRRTRAGGDARLHDLWSIGVGGHLNPGDGDVAGGLRREWAEEIEAAFVPPFHFIGLLNDDTTDVGSVHLGLVFEADAEGRPVAIRETDKLAGSFEELATVRDVYDGLETWSQLILPSLAPDVG
jgi:predicted NUDIX family phosphoesterase